MTSNVLSTPQNVAEPVALSPLVHLSAHRQLSWTPHVGLPDLSQWHMHQYLPQLRTTSAQSWPRAVFLLLHWVTPPEANTQEQRVGIQGMTCETTRQRTDSVFRKLTPVHCKGFVMNQKLPSILCALSAGSQARPRKGLLLPVQSTGNFQSAHDRLAFKGARDEAPLSWGCRGVCPQTPPACECRPASNSPALTDGPEQAQTFPPSVLHWIPQEQLLTNHFQVICCARCRNVTIPVFNPSSGRSQTQHTVLHFPEFLSGISEHRNSLFYAEVPSPACSQILI